MNYNISDIESRSKYFCWKDKYSLSANKKEKYYNMKDNYSPEAYHLLKMYYKIKHSWNTQIELVKHKLRHRK